MKETRSIGHVRTMTIKLDSPPFDIDKMEFRALSLFVGQNGSGKSLVLKLNWMINAVAMTITGAKRMGVPFDSKALAQFTVDNTFVDCEFTGIVGAEWDNGVMEIILNAGKVEEVIMVIDDDVTVPPPVFMSTDMRTFDQINQYLKFRKMLGGDQQKLLEMYRLYDFMYVESLIPRMKKGIKVGKQLKATFERFEPMGDYKFRSFHITDDEDEMVYATYKDEKVRSLATLSKGEQSLINMFIAQVPDEE